MLRPQGGNRLAVRGAPLVAATQLPGDEGSPPGQPRAMCALGVSKDAGLRHTRRTGNDREGCIVCLNAHGPAQKLDRTAVGRRYLSTDTDVTCARPAGAMREISVSRPV